MLQQDTLPRAALPRAALPKADRVAIPDSNSTKRIQGSKVPLLPVK
jgi:hypothetical protein